ncbi:MAG: radical SAM protein [Geobacteraceae bacterium]|nr:radical SAM protein [Geobacteraceae bacterium]
MKSDRQLTLALISIHPSKSPQSVPLAAAFLSAAIKKSSELSGSVQVQLMDLFADQTARECADTIKSAAPDMVGFSVYTWNRRLSASTATLLKNELPGTTLFCGGPEATADQSGLLHEAPWDFLVHGEGEGTLVEALKARLHGGPQGAIPGLATLENKKLISSPPGNQLDLATVPSPLLSGEIDPAGYSGMLWQISRGCSFGCEFCFDGGGSRKVRRFPLERIESELRWFVKNGVSQVFVLDSTFNSDRERAVSILRLIKKIAPQIHFHFEVRSEFLDKSQAKLFASITCSLQIGLQSADPVVLKNSGRNFSATDFSSKIALLNETGAVFGFDLIYGLPGDTLSGFRKSLDFALNLYPNHLDIFPLAVLPGTRVAERSRELALEHLEAPPYTLIASPSFGKKDMAAAARLAAACDIFYSRGKAVSWFMSLLHLLKMKPSELLERFYDYALKAGVSLESATELDDERIYTLQSGFVTGILKERKLGKFLPAALDMITFNYHYAAALMAAPPLLPTEKGLAGVNLCGLPLTLASSARLATFSYEILELLDSGVADLREISSIFSPTGSYAVIYPKNGEVLTESLNEAFYRLLEKLDGTTRAGEIARKFGIPKTETESFLRIAALEGIVSLTGKA